MLLWSGLMSRKDDLGCLNHLRRKAIGTELGVAVSQPLAPGRPGELGAIHAE
jgi:hypothetical protein